MHREDRHSEGCHAIRFLARSAKTAAFATNSQGLMGWQCIDFGVAATYNARASANESRHPGVSVPPNVSWGRP